jgi:hypothetical protein
MSELEKLTPVRADAVMILPAPRRKSSLWKFSVWLVVLVIIAQCAWLASIPFLRHTVLVETQVAALESVRRGKRPSAILRTENKDSHSEVALVTPPAIPDRGLALAAPSSPAASSSTVGGAGTYELPVLQLQGPPRLAVPDHKDPSDDILRLQKEAREFRAMGDLSLARAKLREAEALDPTNPEILASLAAAHESLGDVESARGLWQRVVDMGDAAGASLVTARMKIEELQQKEREAARQQVAQQRGRLTQKLRFSAVEDLPAPDRQRVVRTVIAPKDSSDKIDPPRVRIQTFFFELDAEGIYPTKSPVGVVFEDRPVDWASGSGETFTAQVKLAEATPRDRVIGYLFRVYYQDKLQDEIADPPELLEAYPAK